MCPFRPLRHSVSSTAEKPQANGPVDGLPIPNQPSTGDQTADAGCPAKVLVDEKGKIIVDVAPVKGCDLVRKKIHDSPPGTKKWVRNHFRSGGERLEKESQAE